MDFFLQLTEEFMKSDDYTKEQLYKYCDKGKSYVDCINSKLKCCDLKPELHTSLVSYDRQLEKVAWKLGAYCAGIGENNVVKYKCRTTVTKTTTATTTTKLTRPTLPPCPIDRYSTQMLYLCSDSNMYIIERVSDTCSYLLDGKVKFEEEWTMYDKMQWCRDAIDYVACSSQFLLNCNVSTMRYDADQLQNFIDYITKSANIYWSVIFRQDCLKSFLFHFASF
jgi:hypothetical protein